MIKLSKILLKLNPALLITLACWLTLAALALMVFSVFVPRPIPVVLAMSAGQGLGTLAFLLYAIAFVTDLLRAGVLRIPSGKRES